MTAPMMNRFVSFFVVYSLWNVYIILPKKKKEIVSAKTRITQPHFILDKIYILRTVALFYWLTHYVYTVNIVWITCSVRDGEIRFCLEKVQHQLFTSSMFKFGKHRYQQIRKVSMFYSLKERGGFYYSHLQLTPGVKLS